MKKPIKAGLLSSQDLRGLLNASYDKNQKEVNGFQQDTNLSTNTSKVYTNPTTGQTVVAHRGTSGITDWLNNAVYAIGGEHAYKMTPRYKEAERVQKQAESKYGLNNLSTIGHSQAGMQAELLGKKGNEIITLNKATRPFTNKPASNQYDIRTKNDIVSALNPFQKNPNRFTIESKLNPLAAHSIDTLQNTNQIFGKGTQLKVGKGNVTTSNDIDKMSKDIAGYHGCFTVNELPKVLKNGFYVINLNGHSHWTCLMKKGKKYCYYDSFGFQPPQEIEDRIQTYDWNDRENQDLDSSACGFYCVAFMKFMIKGGKFSTFVNLFDKDTKKNEKILSILLV